MTKYLKIVITLLIGTSLFSFSKIGNTITVESIRSGFIGELFTTYPPNAPSGDTTIFFWKKDEYNDKMVKSFVLSRCGWSPGLIPNYLYVRMDTTYGNYGPEALARFKSLFGQDLIKARIKTAAMDEEGNQVEWNHFSGAALQAAFNKLYQQPTGLFQEIGLQKIYDATLKNYVRETTNVIVKVMSNKPAFEAMAKKYMIKATTDPQFDGIDFSNQATQKLVAKLSQECLNDYHDYRIVGAMLRRQCDGSLPMLLSCLKTLLKDYDPGFYKQVALKF